MYAQAEMCVMKQEAKKKTKAGFHILVGLIVAPRVRMFEAE